MSDKKDLMKEAVLDVKKIQTTLENNSKDVIASLMKNELTEAVKQALKEADYDEEDVEKDEEADEEEIETDAPDGDGKDSEEDSEEIALPADDETTPTEDDTESVPDATDTEVPELEGGLDDFEEIDVTGLSDEEFLAVYKKLKDSDELETVSDTEVKIKDAESGNEYIVKTAESGAAPSETPELGVADEEMPELETEEVIYEIELTEDKVRKPGHDPKDEVKSGTSEQKGDIDDVDAPENHEYFGTKPTLVGGEPMKVPGKQGNHAEHIMEQEDEESAVADEKLKAKIEKKGDKIASNVAKKIDKNAKNIEDVVAVTGKAAETGFQYEQEEKLDELQSLAQAPNRRMDIKPKVGHDRMGQRPAMKKEVAEAVNQIMNTNKKLQEEIKTYKDVVVKMQGALSEMVVDRTNLIHITRLFTENATTKTEKKQILKRFDDGVKSVDDSKKLYKVIAEEFKVKKPMKESVDEKINKTQISAAGVLTERTVYADKALNEETLKIINLMKRVDNFGKE